MSGLEPEQFERRYGPWAVIAGASDGTGACFAEQLAELGLNLVLVSRRERVLEDLGARLGDRHGIEHRVLALDLSKKKAAEAMLAASQDLDVGLYVSNAGVAAVEKFLDLSLVDVRTAIRLNVSTLAEATFGFGRRMRSRGGGIVIMASSSGLVGRPLLAMYGGTKAFEVVFAEALWAELGDEGIDVLGVVAPGMDTPTARRNRGTDAPIPELQRPDDVVRESLAALGREPLVYFPTEAEEAKISRISQERRSDVLAGKEWALGYHEMLKAAAERES